jgi:hypothetical protein
MPPLIYRTPSAAYYLGLRPTTLEKMRLQGTGPRFTKLGPRAVGYLVEDLDTYAKCGRRCSTSDADPASTASQERLIDVGSRRLHWHP